MKTAQQLVATAKAQINEIDVQQLAALTKQAEIVLIDVREPDEYEIVNIGAKLIPLSVIKSRMKELPRDRDIVVHCHHGGRSAQAIAILKEAGFTKLKNLAGGIDLYALEVDSTLPRY